MDWIFKFSDWHNGVPPLGWENTLAFLSMPVLLIATQKASIELSRPPGPIPPEQAQTQKIVGYLPYFLGITALNVPSGLSIYWIVNSILTTGTTQLIKNRVKKEV